MDPGTGRLFLDFSARKLEQYSERIVACLGKLNQDQVWRRGAENENAVANLVLHLCGNLRQWTGSVLDGRPDIRERDKEFAARGDTGLTALGALLTERVRDAVAVLHGLPESRLLDRVTGQGYDLTVLEAIYHVVEHFSMHTGQVLFATKQMTGEDLNFYPHLSRHGGHRETTP
jgi:uncharacterized damage-inducible protein DinB